MASIKTADGRMLSSTRPQLPSGAVVYADQGRVATAGESLSYEAIYEGNPTCGAVVNKLVRQVATLPLKTYSLDANGDRVRLRDHPVQRLIESPAPRCSQSTFKQWLAFPAFIHGNGLVAKYRGPGSENGEPTELLPLSWPFVSGYAGRGLPIEFWSTVQTGQMKYVSVEETVHLAWDSGATSGLGVSPLKQLASTIRLDDSARRYQNSSFDNGARPAGALVPPDGFRYQEGQREELRKEIQNQHGGVDRAFRMALLAPGFQWLPFSHSAVEAELIAARTLNREEIAMVYDVPPPMIGDLTHGTYSNVEELHRMLYVTTLRPWLKLIEETLKVQLIDPEPAWAADGVFVEFDLGEVLRGSKKEEIDAAAEAFANGLMTLNEVRQVLNLPKRTEPDADIPHIQSNNMTPIGRLAKPTDLGGAADGGGMGAGAAPSE